jgi:hypothetical protein
LPGAIRHGFNSKTPPTRMKTDRRGRNREEAGYNRGQRPGRWGTRSAKSSPPTSLKILRSSEKSSG